MLSKERLGELHKRFDNDPDDDLSDVLTVLERMSANDPNKTLIPGENCCPYCLAALTDPPRDYYKPRVYFNCNSFSLRGEFVRSDLNALHDREMRDLLGIIKRTVEYAVEEGAPYPAIVNRVIACIPEEYR